MGTATLPARPCSSGTAVGLSGCWLLCHSPVPVPLPEQEAPLQADSAARATLHKQRCAALEGRDELFQSQHLPVQNVPSELDLHRLQPFMD